MTLQQITPLLQQETKYSKLYFSIINKAQTQNRVKLRTNQIGYIHFEGHHILPKSIFKEHANFNHNNWNRVLLTLKEHFLVHILIWKHYRKLNCTLEEKKMSHALRKMSNEGKVNSSTYEVIKLNLDLSHSKETRKKISESMKKVEANGLSVLENKEARRIETINSEDFDRSIYGIGSNETKKTTILENGLTVIEQQSLNMKKHIEDNREAFELRNKQTAETITNKRKVEIYRNSILVDSLSYKAFREKYPMKILTSTLDNPYKVTMKKAEKFREFEGCYGVKITL